MPPVTRYNNQTGGGKILCSEKEKKATHGIGAATAITGQPQDTRRKIASLLPASFVTNVRPKQKKKNVGSSHG